MPDKPFVINDRRKFTADGDPRPDAPPSEPKPAPQPAESAAPPPSAAPEPARGPQAVPPQAPASADSADEDDFDEDVPGEMPPAPTSEQTDQATRAYDATVDRLDTVMRAANPGAERTPPMTFERLVQSIYMQTILQLGGATEQGQQPQVDLMGARQSIDMMGVLADKTRGNLTENEQKLIDSALFEMRMGFLEVTQALARQAQARQGGGGAPGMPPAPGSGPSIVR